MGYHKKQPGLVRKALRSHVVQAILFFFIIFLALQIFDQYQITQKTAERRIATEEQLQQLMLQREALAEQVTDLQNDYGVEAKIRRNFDVAREGEEVVIILEDSIQAIPSRERATSSYADPPTPKPWYQFWE